MPKPRFAKSKLLERLYAEESTVAPSDRLDTRHIAPWRGSTNGKLMLISSVYPSGSKENGLIIAAVTAAGLSSKDIYWTTCTKHHLIKKLPNGMEALDTRSITVKEIQILRPFLLKEVEIVQPRAILCLGGNSIKVLSGDSHFSVLKDRGRELDIPAIDASVFVTHSPHAVFMGGFGAAKKSQLQSDLKLAYLATE